MVSQYNSHILQENTLQDDPIIDCTRQVMPKPYSHDIIVCQLGRKLWMWFAWKPEQEDDGRGM